LKIDFAKDRKSYFAGLGDGTVFDLKQTFYFDQVLRAVHRAAIFGNGLPDEFQVQV